MERIVDRRWLPWLLLFAVTAVGGCDQNVKFSIFRSSLAQVRAGGSQYSQEAPGSQCQLNTRELDISLLPLTTTRDRKEELLRPGHLLSDCTLELLEGEDDGGGSCYLGTDDIVLSGSRVHLTELNGEPACCGPLCKDPDDPDDTGDLPNPPAGCESLGEGWECNADRAVCRHGLTMKALHLDYVPLGDDSQPRAVAVLMDNSGTLKGRGPDCVPEPSEATDRTPGGTEDSRIAAAKDFVFALDSGRDLVGLYTFDTAGSSGVQSVTEVEMNAAGTRGFVSNLPGVEDAILELGKRVACGPGSPVWDAVVRGADDLREITASRRLNPVIVLFTDGPPDASDAQLSDAIEAVVADPAKAEDDIPVFVVHLDNVGVMDTPAGRYKPYEKLACVSGGAYFRLEDPSKLSQLFTLHLPYATAGHYRLGTSYEELTLGDEFPSGACYAIRTDLKLKVGRTEKILTLDIRASRGKGAEFDTRIHVCKP